MSREELSKFADMKMYFHHIYEYEKGIRNLILCTISSCCAKILLERLDKKGIDYHVENITKEKINLFFGKKECLKALNGFIHKPLNLLTPEEDFMLGIMLGYDITKQCERYCVQRTKSQ